MSLAKGVAEHVLEGRVGYAFVFEEAVIFGDVQDFISMMSGKRSRRKFKGEFLGAVKGLVPHDPHRVLYMRLKDTPAFKKRQAIRRQRRKLGVTRLEARFLKPLDKWIQT